MSSDNNTEFLFSLVKKLETIGSSLRQGESLAHPDAQEDWHRLVKSDKLDIEQRLFIAILLNSKEVVQELLSVGADPNALNMQDTTPLQLALAFGRTDIAILLCDYGARPLKSPISSPIKSPKT